MILIKALFKGEEAYVLHFMTLPKTRRNSAKTRVQALGFDIVVAFIITDDVTTAEIFQFLCIFYAISRQRRVWR